MAIDRINPGDPLSAERQNQLIDLTNRTANPNITGGGQLHAGSMGIGIETPGATLIGIFELTEKLWFPTDEDPDAPVPPECDTVPDVPYTLNAKRIYLQRSDNTYNDFGHDGYATLYQPTVLRDAADAVWSTASYGIGSRVAAFWNAQSGHWEICERPCYVARIELTATYEPGDASVTAILVDDPREPAITVYVPAEAGAVPPHAHQFGIGRAGQAGPPAYSGTLGYAIWQPVRRRWELLVLNGLETTPAIVTEAEGDGGIAEDAEGTVRVYWLDYNNAPAHIDSGIDVEAFNWCGPDIAQNMRVEITLDRHTGIWRIINAKPRILIEKDDAPGGLADTIDFHDTGFTTITVVMVGSEADVTINSI